MLHLPWIDEFRQIGMIEAIKLVKNKKTKEAFDWKKRVGYEIYQIAVEKGVLLRPVGDVIYFMPPYVVEEEDIDFLIDVTAASIQAYFERN